LAAKVSSLQINLQSNNQYVLLYLPSWKEIWSGGEEKNSIYWDKFPQVPIYRTYFILKPIYRKDSSIHRKRSNSEETIYKDFRRKI